MKVIRSLEELPAGLGATAVTIGKFDGLHCGHRRVIGLLREAAAERGLAPVAVTFDRHPAALFAPDKAPCPIVSLEQKLALLAGQGLAGVLVLPFTRETASIEAIDFIERILVEGLGMRLIVVGRDFRFGAKGAGDSALLLEHADRLGYEVVLCDDEPGPTPDEAMVRRASSTWVRELLEAGDVAGAARVLGRPHTLSGEVVHGAKRGRELGFPTANLTPALDGFIPADGVYAGWLDDGERSWPAAISVGDNPTFEGVPQKQVEAHVINATLDLYGKVVEVSFIERIRGMVRFEGLEPLIARMGQDVEEAREILARPESAPPARRGVVEDAS